MPQIISEFYLALFLESIKDNGYLIFGISGNFPEFSHFDQQTQLRENQKLIDFNEIMINYEASKKAGKYKLNIGSGEQDAIDKALEESLRIFNENENKKKEEESKKNAFNQKVMEQMSTFQGKSVQISTETSDKCIVIRLSR